MSGQPFRRDTSIQPRRPCSALAAAIATGVLHGVGRGEIRDSLSLGDGGLFFLDVGESMPVFINSETDSKCLYDRPVASERFPIHHHHRPGLSEN